MLDTIVDESLFLSVSASFTPGLDFIYTKDVWTRQHDRRQSRSEHQTLQNRLIRPTASTNVAVVIHSRYWHSQIDASAHISFVHGLLGGSTPLICISGEFPSGGTIFFCSNDKKKPALPAGLFLFIFFLFASLLRGWWCLLGREANRGPAGSQQW